MTQHRAPIACSLPMRSAARQAVEWADLRPYAVEAEDIENGIAITFAIAAADTVEDLADREARCCAFLSLATTREPDAIRLDITSADPEARPVIEALAALAAP
jgi:hypothetical protein